jgi:hypothetical protein
MQLATRRARAHITVDPTQGWKAYPDFVQRFAKLWGADQ